ncbi:MAG TPA: GDSL-type esterase/lipase family protein [Jiangellaceae bacterium]|nr:GDSL-type esterase/lipase family protein [Jiangellaceae bacterium]
MSTPPRDVRVCVFGDSFVAGVGDPKALGWVGRVAARTPSSTGVALTMYSLGVRGQSTEDVVVRMPLEISPRFARGDEHGVVLAVGVADAFAAVAVARSAATLEFGLRSTGLRRLVVGPPPVGPDDLRRRIAELDGAYAELCARLDVPYVSTYGPLAEHGPWLDQRFADGVHPGQAGYGMLAYVVLHGGWYDWLGVPVPAREADARRRRRAPGATG